MGTGPSPETSENLEVLRKKGTLKEVIKLYRQKKWDQALSELRKIDTERFRPEDNIELTYYFGLIYTKLERFDEAIMYLEQVINSGKEELRIHQCRMALAYIYAVTKKFRMAEFELNRLASKGFVSAQLYATLAYAAWSQKHYKQAVDFYEKALGFDRDNANALNGLGYVLIDADLDLPRGLRCCRKAVDMKPNNAAYLDSLGWAYYKNGDMLEARTWLRRALDAAPQNKEIRQHYKIVMEKK